MFSLQHDKLYFNLVSIEVESKDCLTLILECVVR